LEDWKVLAGTNEKKDIFKTKFGVNRKVNERS
jgi:hypothetical protein